MTENLTFCFWWALQPLREQKGHVLFRRQSIRKRIILAETIRPFPRVLIVFLCNFRCLNRPLLDAIGQIRRRLFDDSSVRALVFFGADGRRHRCNSYESLSWALLLLGEARHGRRCALFPASFVGSPHVSSSSQISRPPVSMMPIPRYQACMYT